MKCPHGVDKSHHHQRVVPGYGYCLTTKCGDCQRLYYRAAYASNRQYGHGRAWRELLPIVGRVDRTPHNMFQPVSVDHPSSSCDRCGNSSFARHRITVETMAGDSTADASRSVCARCRDEFDEWWGREE